MARLDSLTIEDKTTLEIKDAKMLFKKESDWYDKYSSGIIATVTVFISLGISVWQARKTTKANRANAISEARITWVNNLRPIMSDLIVLATSIHKSILDMRQFYDYDKKALKTNLSKVDKEMVHEIFDSWKKEKRQFDSVFNQIKLFLNPKEKEHKEFIDSVDSFIDQARSEIKKDQNTKGKFTADDLIIKAQIVLKDAWEQAKNEGSKNRMI